MRIEANARRARARCARARELGELVRDKRRSMRIHRRIE
ncbi:hypothetical protein A2U01_0115469, partial [Trifolium medium]|nr:hypothetical protein [Trifolium medium]